VIEVVAPGPLTTVQDGGRPGYAHLGVPRSGAFDQAALRLANRLVGNPEDAAALEVTLGGLQLRFDTAATVALAGAQCAGLAWGEPVSIAAGAHVRLAAPARGLRSYLAIRGGVDVPAQLGSRSTDVLSGLGPPPLRAGDVLRVGALAGGPVPGIGAPPAPRPEVLRVLAGPRDDWFEAGALETLTRSAWTVRSESDRIGIRLDGPQLRRSRSSELPSEPTRPGAIQVPADARPIVFGPDAPVTGGYPVLAVVLRSDLDAAGQLRPGDTVRFTVASVEHRVQGD
jgi:biotin-dependent carboxylase-like uncharacterized protein